MSKDSVGGQEEQILSASATAISLKPSYPCRYSICTFVTSRASYAQMLASYRQRGFVTPRCEFLYIDNTAGNTCDAFQGGNALLAAARGRYVIVCHQDVVLIEHGLVHLDRCIDEVSRVDPCWAVLGNAGGVRLGQNAIRITDAFGTFDTGTYPTRVVSLDENFLLLKNEAGLRFSSDLSGFHFYGTDICQVASFHGYRAYVIDFHLHHLSGTLFTKPLEAERQRLIRKYQDALRPRYLQTTCAQVYLSGSRLRNRLWNSKHGRSIYRRLYKLRWALRRVLSPAIGTKPAK